MQQNKYERYFSNFLSDVLPSSKEWMWISDIDFVLYNKASSKFCMIELKTRGNTMAEWQKEIYREIHKRLVHTNEQSKMKFIGTYCIEFDGADFEDWRVWITGSWIERTEVYMYSLADFINWQLT